MTLEQFYAQAGFQRVDMPDHSRMVDPQNIRRAADRSQTRHLKGGSDLIPIVHHLTCALIHITCVNVEVACIFASAISRKDSKIHQGPMK